METDRFPFPLLFRPDRYAGDVEALPGRPGILDERDRGDERCDRDLFRVHLFFSGALSCAASDGIGHASCLPCLCCLPRFISSDCLMSLRHSDSCMPALPCSGVVMGWQRSWSIQRRWIVFVPDGKARTLRYRRL